jgi:DNA-binding transcriptional MerR regulator
LRRSGGVPGVRRRRAYDGLGLLSPARVDELTGYRHCERGQLDQARLIATLRHVGVPLAAVRQWLALDPAGMADRVTTFWREAESRHAAQQKLQRNGQWR